MVVLFVVVRVAVLALLAMDMMMGFLVVAVTAVLGS